MTTETRTLGALGIEVPEETYDVGYGTPAPSYAELLADAFEATDQHIDRHSPVTRNLSTFSTLQAAFDWSDANYRALYLDEDFETDETRVRAPVRLTLFGDGMHHSLAPRRPAIISTNTANNDPFIYYDDRRMSMQLDGVNFRNTGNSRPFFVPDSPDGGLTWTGFNTDWSNVGITGFGSTDGYPYTVHLENWWGAGLSNVTVNNTDAGGYGAWKLTNCNAAAFKQLTAVGNHATDEETPVVYVDNCHALHLDSPYIEHYTTDAAMQISQGNVTLTNYYTEPQSSGYGNVGLQIGDGGLTAGHTNGSVEADCRVTITEPVIHAMNKSGLHPNPDWMNNMRLLNFDHVNLVGGPRRPELSSIEYGGSEYDSAQGRVLDTDVGALTVTGNTEMDVTNSTGGVASVSIQNGRAFASEADAAAGLLPFESGWVDTGSAVAWVRKSEDGVTHIFEPSRTL